MMKDKSCYVIVINCGSSSLKWSLFDSRSKQHQLKGLVEAIGTDAIKASATAYVENQKIQLSLTGKNFFDALSSIKKVLEHFAIDLESVRGVGHRVVHGGEVFSDAALLDSEAIEHIKSLSPLAPLHNPANLIGIEIAQEIFTDIPHVAVFDTSFHQTIEPSEYTFPVDYALYEKHKIRRYGFHGTSHDYVYHRLAEHLNCPTENFNVITAHLGNGCSLCAIASGKSCQTTMGLTPLDGVMMGTRSGTVDPGIFEYLQRVSNMNVTEITNILNKKSGILGISGHSHDLRDVEEKASLGDYRSQLALDMFSKSIASSLMKLTIHLPALDAIVLTGGIGENSTVIQDMVMKNLHHLNVKYLTGVNPRAKDVVRLSCDQSLPIYKVSTDEEKQIALKVLDITGEVKV